MNMIKVTLINWHWDFEDAKQSMAHEVWLQNIVALLFNPIVALHLYPTD